MVGGGLGRLVWGGIVGACRVFGFVEVGLGAGAMMLEGNLSN